MVSVDSGRVNPEGSALSLVRVVATLNIVTKLCQTCPCPLRLCSLAVQPHVGPSLVGFTSLLCWLVLLCGGFLVEHGLLVLQLVLDACGIGMPHTKIL